MKRKWEELFLESRKSKINNKIREILSWKRIKSSGWKVIKNLFIIIILFILLTAALTLLSITITLFITILLKMSVDALNYAGLSDYTITEVINLVAVIATLSTVLVTLIGIYLKNRSSIFDTKLELKIEELGKHYEITDKKDIISKSISMAHQVMIKEKAKSDKTDPLENVL